MMLLRAFAWLGLLVCVATTVATTVATPLISQEPPHPVKNAASGVMLSAEGLPADPREIDFKSLPRLRAQHVIVSDVREVREVRAANDSTAQVDKQRGGVNQHNYLSRFGDQFFLMWSDGPGVEDRVGQRVKYATSADGLNWQIKGYITPEPPGSGPGSKFYGTRSNAGFRYIARGFWLRDGQLLALASLDEASGFFGPSLALYAFRWDESSNSWTEFGLVAKDAINNFPPRAIRDGQWLMSRRKHNYKQAGVEFLIGGVKALDDWQSFPVFGSNSELKAEEPEWWELPDGNLVAVFRDNSRSGFLFRSFSTDGGRTWTKPVKTNFPDATSKMCGLRLLDGRYVLVSNANPKRRDPLTLAISPDGIVFDKLYYLVGERHVDYPHVIEHDGSLLIAFSGGKQTVEVLRISHQELNSK